MKTLLALLAALSVGAWFVLREALARPPDYQPLPLPSWQDLNKAEKAITELTELVTATPRPAVGRRREFTKRLTQKMVNDYLAGHPAPLPANLPVDHLQVTFSPGVMGVTGVVRFHGRPFYVHVSGTLSFPDGRTMRVAPTEIRVGNIVLPAALRERVTEFLLPRAPRVTFPPHVYIRALEVNEDSVIIYGDEYAD